MGGVTISVEKPPVDFIFSVTTTNTPHTFSLPTVVGGNYDYVVDWGDDSSDHITTYNDPNRIHSYATPATYDITISGTFTGLRFGGSGALNGALVTDIKQWGIFNPGNNIGVFRYCTNLTNLTASDILDLTGVTTLEQFFYGNTNLATIPNINSWDVSGIEVMEYVLSGTSFNQDISNWDVSSVTNMYHAVSGSLFDQDISGWNVSNVINFGYMFYDTPFDQDIGGWDVSSGTLFNSMFYDADSFNQDISGWITSSATNFQSMFYLNNGGFDQNIGGWDIANVTAMNNMFGARSISTVNYDALLIGWEGQAVKDNVTFDGGTSKYTGGGAVATARQALIDDHSWVITDGGIA